LAILLPDCKGMEFDLAKNIVQYLMSNERVFLKDVGAFYIKTLNKSFEHVGHAIRPPTKTVAFDQTAHIDSDFINHIANKYNLSIDEAQQVIRDYSSKIWREIKEKSRSIIPGLGILKKNQKGEIEFVSNQRNFDKRYTFLPIIHLTPIQKENQENLAQKSEISKIGRVSAIDSMIEGEVQAEKPLSTVKSEAMSTINSSFENTSKSEDYVGTSSYYDEPEKGCLSSILVPLLWLFGILAICFFAFKYFGSDVDKNAASEIVDKVGDGIDKAGDSVSDALTGDGKNQDFGKYAAYLTEEIVENGCVIVVGSFKRTRNALKLRQQIISKGYTPYTESYNGFDRVGIVFDCLDKDLVDYLQDIRSKINQKAWFLSPQMEVPYR